MFVSTNERRAGQWGGVRTAASGVRAAEWAVEMSGHTDEKQVCSMSYVAGIFNVYGVHGAAKHLWLACYTPGHTVHNVGSVE